MKKMMVLMMVLVPVLTIMFNSLSAFAQTADEDFAEIKEMLEKNIIENPISNCHETLTPAFDAELIDFLKFLETNFQNKSANSSLVNIAISRFSEYKNKLKKLFAKLRPGGTAAAEATIQSYELAAYQDCARLKDSYIDLAKEKMIEHVKNTNAQKKATILIEKYQAINSRLRDLNLQVARMYGFFMTFKEKLPFFVENCVKS